LADGTNPFTGEIFPDDSPYQHPEMVRALHKAIELLEVEATRERKRKHLPENTGKPWTDEEDNQLISEFESNLRIPEIAERHKRTTGGIQARLERLGKIERIFRRI